MRRAVAGRGARPRAQLPIRPPRPEQSATAEPQWHACGTRPRRTTKPAGPRPPKSASDLRVSSERVTGIEPAFSAWEADVLPLNYTREAAHSSAAHRAGQQAVLEILATVSSMGPPTDPPEVGALRAMVVSGHHDAAVTRGVELLEQSGFSPAVLLLVASAMRRSLRHPEALTLLESHLPFDAWPDLERSLDDVRRAVEIGGGGPAADRLHRLVDHLRVDATPRLGEIEEHLALVELRSTAAGEALELARRRCTEPDAAPHWFRAAATLLLDDAQVEAAGQVIDAAGGRLPPEDRVRRRHAAAHHLDLVIPAVLDPTAAPIASRGRILSGPRRVAVLHHRLDVGGAQLQTVELARTMAAAGDEVRFVVADLGGAPADVIASLAAAGIEVVELAARPPDRSARPEVAALFHHLREATAVDLHLERLHEALVAWAPDVVVATGSHEQLSQGGLVSVLAGAPGIVLAPRGMAPPVWGGTLQREATVEVALHAEILRRLVVHPAVVLAPITVASGASYEEWLGVRPLASVILPPSVDIEQIRSASRAAPELPWPAGSQVVGGVFALTPIKRPLLWLEVASALLDRFPDLHAVLVGDGELGEAVREAAERIGPRLHLLGLQWPATPWIAQLDLLLHTSASEGRALVILEAGALGVPVVAGASPGVRDALIHGRDGLLVEPDDDPAAYVAAVASLLDGGGAALVVGVDRERAIADRAGTEALRAALDDIDDLLPTGD